MKFDFSGFNSGEKKLIKKVFSAAVKKLKQPRKVSVAVSCVDSETIAALNLKFRQIDAPTDVLSFPSSDIVAGETVNIEKYPAETDGKGFYSLGDIIVCREIMSAQANEYGHGEKRELAFLALHGLLHLLGYDHGDDLSAEEMEQLAENILAGCKITR